MKLLVSSNWLILEFDSIVLCIFYECMDYCKFDDLFYVVMRTEGPPSIKMSLLFEKLDPNYGGGPRQGFSSRGLKRL